MREKWSEMAWLQRAMLLLQFFLVVLFLILYITLGRQQVIIYKDTLFRCQYQGDTAVYLGKLDGQKAAFTVSPGPVVEFNLGDILYGPYSIAEDSTAIPATDSLSSSIPSGPLTGVEIRKGSEVWFRGAYYDVNFPILVSEDGASLTDSLLVRRTSNPEPSVLAVLRIALNPQPVSRGNWGLFWMGVLCCLICTVMLLFADELFWLHLRFRVQAPEQAEPSEWEILSRWLGWIIITIIALVSFVIGLNTT